MRRFLVWWRWRFAVFAFMQLIGFILLPMTCAAPLAPMGSEFEKQTQVALVGGLAAFFALGGAYLLLERREQRIERGREWRHRVAQERSGLR